MNHFVVSEISHVLLVVALLSRLLRRLIGGRRGAWIGFALGAILTVLPPEYSPTFYTRGLLGELSALSLIFLAHFLVKGLYDYQLIPRREGYYLAVTGLTAAFMIYPASLGVNAFPDVYEFGYGSAGLISAMGGLGAFFLWRGCPVAVTWIGLSFFLYGFRLHPSLNFWDSLIDLPSVMVCAGFLLHALWRRIRDGKALAGRRGLDSTGGELIDETS